MSGKQLSGVGRGTSNTLCAPKALPMLQPCQYFMEDILREHLDIFCVGLLDDVIVYSATPEEHVGHVRTILAILRQHQLYAKIQKCKFDKEEMTFVGYQVSKSGIGMDPAKVAAILDWPTPKNLKEV